MKFFKKWLLPLLFGVAAMFMLTGCSLDDAIDILDAVDSVLVDGDNYYSNENSNYNEPTLALVTLTPTPEATATTAPKATATEAPKATATSTPTSTPKPTATTKPTNTPKPTATATPVPTKAAIDENGSYDSKDEVALYIHTYGKLPKNYITKKEAEALGWTGGSVEKYAKGKCLGGHSFGNYEGLLPKKSGRKYYECDIDTLGKSSRGAKRIVYSNDGLIYYTDDHYESFTLLYGEP